MNSVLIDQLSGKIEGSLKQRAVVGVMRNLARPWSLVQHRGYSRICKTIAEASLPGIEARVQLNEDTLFCFPLNDMYWVRLISTSFKYEPELANILKRIRNRPFTFIDAGANFGLWSCLVSSQAFGAHRSVAVEPSTGTYSQLERNRSLNGDRFLLERAAVSDVSGQVVRIGGQGSHASRSILEGSGEEVETITIDDLVAKHQVVGPIVLKLDVEGVEVRALKGSTAALARDVLILYEDHGSDKTSEVSAHLLDEGWQVFRIDQDRPVRIHSVDEVNAMKTDPRTGYNFAACRTAWW